jgi:hypothetical protein
MRIGRSEQCSLGCCGDEAAVASRSLGALVEQSGMKLDGVDLTVTVGHEVVNCSDYQTAAGILSECDVLDTEARQLVFVVRSPFINGQHREGGTLHCIDAMHGDIENKSRAVPGRLRTSLDVTETCSPRP